MRNLLALVGAAVVAFAAVGWYLDWYHIKSAPGQDVGHQNVSVDINSAKIFRDGQKGVKKIEAKLQQIDQAKPAETVKHAEPTPAEPPLDPPGQ
jgi:hypothetical protein